MTAHGSPTRFERERRLASLNRSRRSWAGPVAASGFVQVVDHWIAFVLLAAVGGQIIYATRRKTGE